MFLYNNIKLGSRDINFLSIIKNILIVYHLVFPFVFWYLTAFDVIESDPEKFIRIASSSSSWFSLFGLGNSFMCFVAYPFVKMGFSYLLLNVLFSLISLKGFLIYIDIFKKNNFFNKSIHIALLTLWLFLPSLHFWTSFFGKEAIIFLTMALLLKAIVNQNYKSPLLFVFLSLSFFARPYSLILFSIAGTIILFVYSKYSIKRKVIFFGAVSALILVSTPSIIKHFLNIENFDGISDLIITLYSNIQESQRYNGSHFFDIFETSYLEKLSILLFRPLFFDAPNLMGILSSVENTIVILSFIVLFYLLLGKQRIKLNISIRFAFLTSLLFLLVIGSYIYNLGLASRMRVMIIPYLFYGLTSSYRLACVEVKDKKG